MRQFLQLPQFQKGGNLQQLVIYIRFKHKSILSMVSSRVVMLGELVPVLLLDIITSSIGVHRVAVHFKGLLDIAHLS